MTLVRIGGYNATKQGKKVIKMLRKILNHSLKKGDN
jgi:hypothetical protein